MGANGGSGLGNFNSCTQCSGDHKVTKAGVSGSITSSQIPLSVKFVTGLPQRTNEKVSGRDVLRAWLDGEPQPTAGTVLAFAPQPHVPYWRELLRNTLPKDFGLQVTGHDFIDGWSDQLRS